MLSPEARQQIITIFTNIDVDKKGFLNADQTCNLLMAMELNDIYLGTLCNMIRLINYTEQENQTVNVDQVCEIYSVLKNPSKTPIWNQKYELKSSILAVRKDLAVKPVLGAAVSQAEEAGAGAQAGAGPVADDQESDDDSPLKNQDFTTEGSISLKVGPKNTVFNSQIEFSIKKTPKPLQQALKPFGKLQIEFKSNEAAICFQEKFKALWDSFGSILKSQISWGSEIDNIHLNTTINGTTLTIIVTVSNQDLLELIQLAVHFVDQSVNLPFDFDANFLYRFNFDFGKYAEDPNYTHYNLFTNNIELKAQWSSECILKAFQHVVGVICIENVGNQTQSLTNLLMTSLIHLESTNLQLEFENLPDQNHESQSKSEILEILKELVTLMDGYTESGLDIITLIEKLGHSISIECFVGDWKASLKIKCHSLGQLFTKIRLQNQNNSNGSNSGNNSQNGNNEDKYSSKGANKALDKSQESIESSESVESDKDE